MASKRSAVGRETTVLFLGNKGAGKTSLINLFKGGFQFVLFHVEL
jgi:putative ribosome biogenesis GTPase RsgA